MLSAEGRRQRVVSKLQESPLQTLQEGYEDTALNGKALEQAFILGKKEEEGHRRSSAEASSPSARGEPG